MLAGCAAAVTIPKDYFYSVYYMDEGKVDAWLNGEMPLESELTADIIESVAEIMAGERAAMLAAFRIAEGDEPSAEAVQRFRDACANAVLDSAMGRRAVLRIHRVLSGAFRRGDSRKIFCLRCVHAVFQRIARNHENGSRRTANGNRKAVHLFGRVADSIFGFKICGGSGHLHGGCRSACACF